MNTERPDHDDEPRPVSGDAPDTEGARPRTTSSSEAPASDTDAVGTRDAAAEDPGSSGTSAPAGDAGGLTRTGEAGSADRPEETRPEGGPSEAGTDGSDEVRPAAGVHRTGAAGAEGPAPKATGADAPAPSRLTKPEATGPADGDAPRTGETGPSQAAADAGDEPAPAHAPVTSAHASADTPASTPGAAGPEGASDESRAEGNGSAPADASTDTGAAGEDRPARADAPSAGADGGESSGASAAEASGPAGGTPTAPRTPPAGDEHAYAGPEPVVGGSRDADRASEGPARRRTPALVASVAAAVLLVGGGGAYLAAGAGDSGGGAAPGANGDATPPPLALDGYSESGPNGIAPGEPNPYGATYRAEGALPDGPDTAPVFHARGKITEDQVVALAEALGVEGRPFAEGGSWRIGGQDGSGPTLRVDTQAPGTWTFSRNITRSDNCKGATCKAPTGAKTAAVSEEAAKKAAAPVLKAVGQDDAKLDASQVLDGSRVVNADPEVGGLPTYGWTTGVVVGASGEVVGGSGRLAEPVKGDEYPVVSAREALDAMNGAPGAGDRVEIGGCATPVPLDEGQQEEPCAPAKPAGDTVAVDEAVFGLAAHSVDGRPALVPSWLFEVRPAGSDNPFTVTHPAVEPQFLAAPTGPGERPGEEPSGPGDEPTSAPATRDVEVEGYTAQGDELTVTFTGGVCADYEATASESGGKVTVRVTETPWPDKVCILIAKQYEQTLRLDAPLGDRQVVTADGEPVPLHKGGARLPAPPSAR
ncbi:hypothetical protein [Streptomyces sp. enrichment culture]|uniref:hypothetical protein n=1 Tax=Streptomyces sp. enrichment culture TaxID=1795815 RepID=UPI003F5709A6